MGFAMSVYLISVAFNYNEKAAAPGASVGMLDDLIRESGHR